MSTAASGGIEKFFEATAGAVLVDFFVALLRGFSLLSGSSSRLGITRGFTVSSGSQGIIRPFANATQIAVNNSGSLVEEENSDLRID